MSFVGKVAIVTGAAMGNGRAIALGLAQAGAHIIAADVNLDLASETCREVEVLGRRTLAVKTDVSVKSDVENLVEQTLDHFNRIDVLVNNAGITSRYELLELPEEEWDRVIDVNLKGVYLCTQAVARAMIELGIKGKIINISSIAASRGVPDGAHYCASKAGVELFTQAGARSLADKNIYVNAIAPGVMDTPMLAPYLADPDRHEQFLASTPLGRIGHPQDLVGAVRFLAGPDSDYVTGIVLRVDGGMLA
ncbi:MAG: 3-oxoacyl-ACP reductase FabG [Anaerolineae bacterium]|jgi:NAD(P)-dependent dehydrogenase (short-subunit alcohol dehydrogenase family)|nr:3-oxoacyl-ACP reductase FabG [Anaerolineae bacterium]